jgi:hypothetical protein
MGIAELLQDFGKPNKTRLEMAVRRHPVVPYVRSLVVVGTSRQADF